MIAHEDGVGAAAVFGVEEARDALTASQLRRTPEPPEPVRDLAWR